MTKTKKKKRKNKKTPLVLKIIALVLLFLILAAGIATIIAVNRYKDAEAACEMNGSLPRLDVDTGGLKIRTKEEYVECSVSVSGTQISEYAAGIRTRGNTTSRMPKKPYRIKFNEDVAVFGGEKNKSWVLLALYNDFSAVKDRLAFAMANALDTDAFIPNSRYVELYLNGKYKGLYLLTDQIDENAGRASVKEPFSADDTEVPFLIEMDDYAPEEGTEGVDWFTVSGKPYAIKYPELHERYTDEQFEYIKNYVERVDAACMSGSLEELQKLVDIDSFIDYYLLQEAMGQIDINGKSVYMYKSKTGKMKMGPVWDFDWSANGPIWDFNIGTLGHSVGKDDFYTWGIEGFRSSRNWFYLMLEKSPEFKSLFSVRIDGAKEAMLTAIEAVRAEAMSMKPYFDRNALKWHWYILRLDWNEYCNETLDWVRSRIEWLDAAV